jgi:hypothetical protein
VRASQRNLKAANRLTLFGDLVKPLFQMSGGCPPLVAVRRHPRQAGVAFCSKPISGAFETLAVGPFELTLD